MIVYELRCTAGHGFETWFRNSDAYDQQHAAHQIACPVCGTNEVSKAPMAPRIARSRESVPMQNTPAPPPGPPQGPSQGQLSPDQMRMVMTKIAELNKHIAETCDYVGRNFAEEARKIHYGEVEHREIYGEATPAEAEELRDEGIAVASVPWIRRSDS